VYQTAVGYQDSKGQQDGILMNKIIDMNGYYMVEMEPINRGGQKEGAYIVGSVILP